jgi:hypothetical protein
MNSLQIMNILKSDYIHLQRRCLRTFYHQIVYLTKYERNLEGIFLTQILPINLDRNVPYKR